MARDVGLDVGLRELHHLSPWSFVWFNTSVKAILDDQGHGQVLLDQLQVLVVKMPKLFVRVALAADVELLGLL